jgi:hypothetical protein
MLGILKVYRCETPRAKLLVPPLGTLAVLPLESPLPPCFIKFSQVGDSSVFCFSLSSLPFPAAVLSPSPIFLPSIAPRQLEILLVPVPVPPAFRPSFFYWLDLDWKGAHPYPIRQQSRHKIWLLRTSASPRLWLMRSLLTSWALLN